MTLQTFGADFKFQSTPPARGGDGACRRWPRETKSFNPRPPRGGATERCRGSGGYGRVSIHAPRAGGRPNLPDKLKAALSFQSTPPARGGDSPIPRPWPAAAGFNPRPPRGGATAQALQFVSGGAGFNPRPPRGGATLVESGPPGQEEVSIHAPRAGGRPVRPITFSFLFMFQSTPPARGGDLRAGLKQVFGKCFNPRPPRGGATRTAGHTPRPGPVSIHAPRAGGRHSPTAMPIQVRCFNPRPPRGGATLSPTLIVLARRRFNPRPPRGGATC